jgi:hypothetical protein
MRRLRKFVTLPPADRRLTMEAAAWLTLALGLLALLPFRRIAGWFGEAVDGDAPLTGLADGRRQAEARRIGRAVERAARHLPMNVRCLPQAIAAKAMLGRRGIASTMHFGVQLSDGGSNGRISAHAWVTVGETGVIGLAASAGFTVLARFTHEVTARAVQ